LLKTHIYNFFLCLALMSLGAVPESSAAPAIDEEQYNIESIRILGANRSDHNWIVNYLNLKLPLSISEPELKVLEEKLLTSKVFTSANIQVHKSQMVILVDEKWTLIPVIRGAIGGGTPLAVLGAYDIHLAGKLLTLGGEIRKYGDANPGGILYWRNPRWCEIYFLGGEMWKNNRVRGVYDNSGNYLGNLKTENSIFRINALRPIDNNPEANLKVGIDLKFVEESKASFEPDTDASSTRLSEIQSFEELSLNIEPQNSIFLLSTFVYDDMKIENINMSGYRALARSGPQMVDGKIHGKSEIELFAFNMLANDLNGVFHGFIGSGSSDSVKSLYRLGGFDSVRGYPDGIIYGQDSIYANFELRKLLRSSKYVWFQPTLFYDVGYAGENWQAAEQNQISSAGVGLRFAVPQIYRMMIRIDYAWSTDGSGQKGITAGMNQFFQPYRPL
jgi:hypothetical protein